MSAKEITAISREQLKKKPVISREVKMRSTAFIEDKLDRVAYERLETGQSRVREFILVIARMEPV
ncbi:MAG: hypothetical protein R3C24_17700 [Cyanobacteriota/Melainabacteria group bacterium]